MARAPFYKVIIIKTGRDISDLVSKISYEDAVDQDSQLSLFFERPTTDLIDDPSLQEGALLSFQFGYISGKMSQVYIAKVADIMPTYDRLIGLTIRAMPMGLGLKKRESKKVWKNLRSSEIVQRIAQAHGLKAVVDRTVRIHASMPQGGKTDYDFIKYLTTLEANGSWRFFMRNNELHFTRLKLEQTSRVTFAYNDANGTVLSFKPYSIENLKKAESRDTVVTSVDPFTNQVVKQVVNNSTSSDDVKTGEYMYHYNFNSEQVNKNQNQSQTQPFQIGGGTTTAASGNGVYSPNFRIGGKPTGLYDKIAEYTKLSAIQADQKDPAKAGKHIYNYNADIDEILNHGNKKKKKAALFDYSASLMVEGDPDHMADTIVTMSGVAKKDSGNWYVTRVNHTIDSTGGYKCRLTLNKNAGKKPIDPTDGKQTNVNKTTGTVQKENQADSSVSSTKKELAPHYYDSNGRELMAPTTIKKR